MTITKRLQVQSSYLSTYISSIFVNVTNLQGSYLRGYFVYFLILIGGRGLLAGLSMFQFQFSLSHIKICKSFSIVKKFAVSPH